MNYLKEKIKEITRALREEYYRYGKEQGVKDVMPFGGSIRESIGPFPEFIMKGRFCKRSLKGYCSPCFYSRLPERKITDSDLNEGYYNQVEYIVENFDDLVIRNQVGRVAFPKKVNVPVYGMVCTPTGSYFDEGEYKLDTRKRSLKKLVEKKNKQGCEIALHIESHAEDIISYFSNPDEEEIALLRELNVRIILGFESASEITRNVLYAKELEMDTFLEAVRILKDNKIPVGAFVFAGVFAYTEKETIEDVSNTLDFLKKIDVSPVLMFANTQKYTISDVLLNGGRYRLVDPFTVMEISKILIEKFGCDLEGDIDPWFIADPKGGPPDPNVHIFNAVGKNACDECSSKIYSEIEKLRITKNAEAFCEFCRKIVECDCYKKYKEFLYSQEREASNNSLSDRISDQIHYVEEHMEQYVLNENAWIVKAELLCYGLNISPEQMSMLESTNPYIDEKGLVHAAHIKYRGVLINVCAADTFSKKSPYSLKREQEKWILYKGQKALDEVEFVSLPNWIYEKVDNISIGEVIRPHADNCISLWPSLNCCFVNKGKGCKFCSLPANKNAGVFLPVQTVVKMIKKVLEYNDEYDINLSGGTCGSSDFVIDYFGEICQGIRKFHKRGISVECAPPKDLNKIQQLYDSGATAIIMNLEIYDERLRKEICPGKAEISRESYLEALSLAVKIFKRGNVSSVLIVGLQPNADIFEACKNLIRIGVVPTLMPFKPLDNSDYEDKERTNPDEYISISKQLSIELDKHCLNISCGSGCAACGACSLEKNLGGL